jgi:uncharacterized SAM-binding protein YcdF (DUF218 family)
MNKIGFIGWVKKNWWELIVLIILIIFIIVMIIGTQKITGN